LLLALATLAVFAGCLLVSMLRTGPLVVADETGYLVNARVLSGGLRGALEEAPFYRGGYSLLLTPVMFLVDSPALAYRLVLGVNALLAASLVPLLYLVIVRHTPAEGRLAVVAALAGASFPAVLTLSQVALSENALFPLICVWLLLSGALLQRADDGVGWLTAAAFGAVAAALWAVHGRMVAAVVVSVGVIGWLAVRRRLSVPAVAAFAVALGVGFLVARQLNHFLQVESYGGRASNEVTERFDRVLSIDGAAAALANFGGQLWYVVTSTFGLVLVTLTWRRAGRIVGVLAAFLGILLVISAGAFPVRTRPDMLIYGRYAEVAVPPLIALGVVRLATAGLTVRLRSVLLPFGILTGLVVLVRVVTDDVGSASRWNVASLPFVTGELGPATLACAAMVAAAGGVLLLATARWRRGWAPLVAIGLFLPVTLYSIGQHVTSTERAVYPSSWTDPQEELRGVAGVGYDLSHYDTIGLYTTQWFLAQTKVQLFDGDEVPPQICDVLSGDDWPSEHPTAPARSSWRDPGGEQVLWHLQRTGVGCR
jgi:hypothetical protein